MFPPTQWRDTALIRHRSPLRGLLAATTAFTLAPASAHAQVTPVGPAAQAPATDIGRVTTSSGGTVADVTPSGTGTRAQAKAAEHNAINKIVVQPLSEIQKLPDVSIAQALERLPGVSLETDSGEGRFINIRGEDADLNSVTFDGVRVLPSNLSSPTGGGRAIALDVLPVGLVGGLEVKETLLPSDDAEGIGGQVNLLPRRPPTDGHPFIEGTLGSGVEALRGTSVTDYSITTGFSFGFGRNDGPFSNPPPLSGFMSNPRPISILFTDGQHNDYRGVDDYEPNYSDQQAAGAPDKLLSSVTLRHYLYNRRRFDRGAEVDFDPNDTDHWYVRYANAGYNEHAGKDFLQFGALDSGFTPGGPIGFLDPADPTGGTFLAPAATVARTSTDTEEETRNQILSWGGSNVLFNRYKLDYRGAYSAGTDKFTSAYNSSFSDPNPVALSYNNQATYPLSYHTVDGTNLLNPNIYQLTSVTNQPTSSADREYSGAANLTVPFHLLTPEDQIETGAILRLRNRVVQNSLGSSLSPNLAGLPLSQFIGGPSLDFYNGSYNIGQSIDEASVAGLLGGAPAPYDPNAVQNDTENVYGGYAQYSGSHGKVGWLAGVRVEDTFGVYRGFTTTTDANNNTFNTPNTTKHAYASYFPSVQLRYDINPTMDMRAIYSTAIGRPGFQQITPGRTFNLATLTLTTGNANLAPIYSDDFDLFYEFYLQKGGKLSFGGFDKELSSYIFQDTTRGTINSPFVPVNTPVNLTTYQNSGPARIYGIEAEYTQQFLFLPAPWNGFGLDTNFTYNQSAATISRDRGDGVIASETLQLPQTSPYNFNVALFYERYPYTFRIAANYVSKDLYSLGSTKGADVYVQQRFRLDIGTAYNINKNIQLYIDGHNLTDQTLKYTETASANRPIQREFYGVDVLGGVRFTY